MNARHALLVAGCAAFVVALTWPQAINPLSVPDSRDSWFNMWRLAWIAHQLRADPVRLFDANIYYPERGTLAYSDAILMQGVIPAPLFWLGLPTPFVLHAAGPRQLHVRQSRRVRARALSHGQPECRHRRGHCLRVHAIPIRSLHALGIALERVDAARPPLHPPRVGASDAGRWRDRGPARGRAGPLLYLLRRVFRDDPGGIHPAPGHWTFVGEHPTSSPANAGWRGGDRCAAPALRPTVSAGTSSGFMVRRPTEQSRRPWTTARISCRAAVSVPPGARPRCTRFSARFARFARAKARAYGTGLLLRPKGL
jgi:hypothetical protein